MGLFGVRLFKQSGFLGGESFEAGWDLGSGLAEAVAEDLVVVEVRLEDLLVFAVLSRHELLAEESAPRVFTLSPILRHIARRRYLPSPPTCCSSFALLFHLHELIDFISSEQPLLQSSRYGLDRVVWVYLVQLVSNLNPGLLVVQLLKQSVVHQRGHWLLGREDLGGNFSIYLLRKTELVLN